MSLRGPMTPRILSIDDSKTIRLLLARLGVRDYVTKPFQEQELLAKAGRIIPLIPRADP